MPRFDLTDTPIPKSRDPRLVKPENTPVAPKEEDTRIGSEMAASPVGRLFSGKSEEETPEQYSVTDAAGAGAAYGSFTGQQIAAGIMAADAATSDDAPDPVYNNFLRDIENKLTEREESFVAPWESLKGTKYAVHAHLFRNRRNIDEWETVKAEIDSQEQMNAALASHPVAGVGSLLGAAVADPINILSIANPALAAANVARWGKVLTVAANVTKNAAKLGAVNYAMAKIEQDKSISLTDRDAYVAGLVGASVGSLVGGYVGYKHVSALAADIEARLTGNAVPSAQVKYTVNKKGEVVEDTSVGAAMVKPTVGNKLDKFTENAFKVFTMSKYFRGATFNTMQSKLSIVRDIGNKIFGSITRKVDEEDDFVTTDSKLRVERGAINEVVMDTNAQYSKILSGPNIGKYASRDDIDKDVFIAVSRKEKNPEYVHPNPEIESLAKTYATPLHKHLKEQVAARLMYARADGVDAPHVSRVWIAQKVRSLSDADIMAFAREHFDAFPENFVDVDDAYLRISKVLETVRNGGRIDDTDDLFDILAEDPDKILSSSTNTGPAKGKGGAASFTKKRTTFIDNEIAAKYGLVETDMQALTANYMLKSRRALEIRRLLDRQGVKSMADLMNKARAEADAEVTRLRNAGATSKEIEKLTKQLNFEIDQMDLLIKEFAGTVFQRTRFSAYVDLVMNYTASVFLPNTVINQVLYDPLIAQIRAGLDGKLAGAAADLVTQGKAFRKLNAEEANAMGDTLDVFMNDNIQVLLTGDGLDTIFGATKLDKFNQASRKVFAAVTQIQNVTAGEKHIARLGIAQGMVDVIDRAVKGTATKAELNRLKDLGLNQGNFKPILEQFNKHGASKGKAKVLNWKEWDEGIAKDKMAQAMQREVDASILTPNLGDKPTIFLTTEWGRLLGTFKSFTAAASTLLVGANLQDKNPARIATTVLMMVAAGYLRSQINNVLQGKDIDTDVETIVKQGVTRSGLLSVLGEAVLQASDLMGANTSNRFTSNKYGGLVMGASYNSTLGIYDLVKEIQNDKSDAYTIGAKMVAITPYANVLYLGKKLQDALKEKSKNDPALKRKRREISRKERIEKRKKELKNR